MDRRDLEPEILGAASNEIQHQYLSPTKANTLLRWEPKFNLDLGLKRTIDWYTDWFKELSVND